MYFNHNFIFIKFNLYFFSSLRNPWIILMEIYMWMNYTYSYTFTSKALRYFSVCCLRTWKQTSLLNAVFVYYFPVNFITISEIEQFSRIHNKEFFSVHEQFKRWVFSIFLHFFPLILTQFWCLKSEHRNQAIIYHSMEKYTNRSKR